MNRPQRHNPIALALWVNAALLAAIFVAMISRGNSPGILPMAFAADEQSRIPLAPQPIAGGGGLFLMPAQFATNTWGCYIMDVDRQTLCAYQFFPADHQLRFVASRGFTYDRMLKNFNTGFGVNGNEMTFAEEKKLAEKEQQDERVKNGDAAPPPAEKQE